MLSLDRNTRLLYVGFAALLTIAAGCSSDDSAGNGDANDGNSTGGCIENETLACLCGGSLEGFQTCTSAGIYTPCDCGTDCEAGHQFVDNACIDIDECSQGLDACAPNASCTNIPGSYLCGCNDGYTGDGMTCTDDDECALGLDDCGTNAVCANVPGSYACTCEDGYEGDGRTCTNIDECTAGTHTCLGLGSECVDTTPGFDCVCRPGYLGDGVTCTPDPDTAVADVSAHPIQITVAGIGDFEIYGLSRIGWDFEITETPIVGGNGRTHKDIARVLWPDITIMEINGASADIANLVAWAEEGEVATPHDITVALEGVAGESFTVNLLGARAISADTTVTTGSTTDEMTAMVIRLGFGVTTGSALIDRVANTLPHAGVYPACATPGRAVEIQGITTVTTTVQDLCWPLDELAMPAVGTSEQLVLNNLRYGEPIYEWMRSVTQFSGVPFERRSISVVEYDLSGMFGWEVNRVNIYEAFPARLDIFNPTKPYTETYLMDVVIVDDLIEQA